MIHQGYVHLDGDPYPVLKLNEKSQKVLFHNEKVFLTKPEEPLVISKMDAGDAYDRELFERLRVLRKTLADQEGVPPYVIFHDTSLKEMSLYYPQSLSDLHRISGIGERKASRYGEVILKEIIHYCMERNIRPAPIVEKRFEALVKQPRSSTLFTTLELSRQHLSFQKIAQKRGLSASTFQLHKKAG